MEIKEFEKLYDFSFKKEFENLKKSYINEFESFENGENEKKLRELFIKIINSNKVRELPIDANFVQTPFNINVSYDNKMLFVSAIENYIDSLIYKILDDGELFFVKCENAKKSFALSEGTYYTLSDYCPDEYINGFKNTYGKNVKTKWFMIGSIDKYISIMSEVLNKKNFHTYQLMNEKYVSFDNDKAFEKYFENK